MIYGYIRVSTIRQDVLNQRYEIEKYCSSISIAVDRWIAETVSGTVTFNKRELGQVLKRAKPGDMIICSELSRLGRNLYMIMDIICECILRKCQLLTVKEGYRLSDDITSKVMAFAFGLSAELERNLISLRTKEALDRKRKEGVCLGRPKGSANAQAKLEINGSGIITSIAAGIPIKKLAADYGVSPRTLYRWLAGRKQNE